MNLPILVTFEMRATMDAAINSIRYALAHGRDDWSPEHVAHVETGLARIQQFAEELEQLRLVDNEARAVETEKQDAADAKTGQKKGKPWSTEY